MWHCQGSGVPREDALEGQLIMVSCLDHFAQCFRTSICVNWGLGSLVMMLLRANLLWHSASIILSIIFSISICAAWLAGPLLQHRQLQLAGAGHSPSSTLSSSFSAAYSTSGPRLSKSESCCAKLRDSLNALTTGTSPNCECQAPRFPERTHNGNKFAP